MRSKSRWSAIALGFIPNSGIWFLKHLRSNEMNLRTTTSLCALALALGASSIFAADAADVAERQHEADYKAATARAKADYKDAKARCDSLSGNEKDVCKKDAKDAHTQAQADAKAERKSSDAQTEAREDKMAANYKAAKERCDSFSGDAKDACIAEAKAKYKQ
jgi:hypothetical protein